MEAADLKLKLELISRITELKEVRIMKELKRLLDFEQDSKPYQLSSEQKDRLELARNEYLEGKIYKDSQVQEEIDKWLDEK